MKPITHKRWEYWQTLCHTGQVEPTQHLASCITGEETIKRSAQWLIDRLYKPVVHPDVPCQLDRELAQAAGIDLKEPINWGDLNVIDVERLGERGFLVTIEEATAGDCPTFCNYIADWMEKWGWTVKVVTEW